MAYRRNAAEDYKLVVVGPDVFQSYEIAPENCFNM